MSERERHLEPVEVDVNTQAERQRREGVEPRRIERDAEIDWRSYDRRSILSRWRR